MCLPEAYQPHVELVVDVLKTQNRGMVRSLKDFLTVLPSPTWVELVLATALCELAETDLDTCRWALQHAHLLEPELDVSELARKLALARLETLDLMQEQDWQLEPGGSLRLSSEAKAQMMANSSTCDRLLWEEILQIRDFSY